MMTGMKTIADKVCTRRVVYYTAKGEIKQIFCKPSLTKIQELNTNEVRKNLELFTIKEVNLSACQQCQEAENIVETAEQIYKPQPVKSPAPDDPRFALVKAEREEQRRNRRPPRLMSDGTVVFDRIDEDDWEPPPLLPGYVRKSDNDWVLIPKRKLCQHVKLKQYKPPTCNCFRFQLLCTREEPHQVLSFQSKCELCQFYTE